MCSLDEIPFKVSLHWVEIQLGEKDPAAAPEIKIPECTQTLCETKYTFTLEKRIMSACGELQQKNRKAKKLPQSVCPTCPPDWLMFSSPQQSCVGRPRSTELWEQCPHHYSLSPNTADYQRFRPLRAVQFLITDSDCEGGYGEDDERSPTEDAAYSIKRSQCSGKQSQNCSFQHAQRGYTLHTSSLKDIQRPLPPAISQKPQVSPHISRAPRRKRAVTRTSGRRRSSSAGSLPSAQQQKHTSHGVRPRTSAGIQDAPADLLCALSKEERDLLEAVTKHGYTLHTSIMALQRTRLKSLDQILSYLMSCEHLCRLGFEKMQVEEALEMFQNCESKAAEFLFLLTQFCEMGFQQSTIKEVLLVHENHKERALEELMTRSS